MSQDEGDAFASSREHFEQVVSFLGTDEAMVLEHGALEERLERDSREVFRRLFQDHLVVRAQREARVEVVDAAGTVRTRVESGHRRALATVFGEVDVERMAYRSRGEENLHPADASLNLPEEKHSHGLRRWAAVEASRGSYDGATDAIERATGQKVGKRQVESLVQRAAADVDDFYEQRSGLGGAPEAALVISVDGKGIVMRPEALRKAARKAAGSSSPKIKTRLSKGKRDPLAMVHTIGRRDFFILAFLVYGLLGVPWLALIHALLIAGPLAVVAGAQVVWRARGGR